MVCANGSTGSMRGAAPSTGSTAISDRLEAGSSLVLFVMRRLAVTIPFLLMISFGVFALVHIAPGDPATSLLGARPSDPATLAVVRARYNLDDPFFVQYGKWLSQVIRGDLGVSIQGNRAVTSTIADRLGVTIMLSLMSTTLVLGIGILLGAVAAYRCGTRLDRAIVIFGVFGISSPAFVTGIFLLYVFGVLLHWFPVFGPGEGFLDRAWHLTLPALALAISVMAIVIKIARAAMIEELARDYVTFARARGLSSRRILFAYVLRNSLIPVVTAAGLIVVGIVAGAIYVEVTFSLPGLGALTIDAIQKRDIPTIQGTTLLFSAFVVLINLTVDVIYTLIDPRIRFGRVGS
ncbi:ABC transporter permease [Ensifer adhaerens]|uniref:ABC transporter permease n=1 Tax=Ensifer adhaerens TaxID=106592 RepID=UPI003850FF05